MTAARRDWNAATSWGETLGSEGRLREAEKAALATASCFCKSCYRGNGEAVPEASVAPLMGGRRHSVRSDMRRELMEIEIADHFRQEAWSTRATTYVDRQQNHYTALI